MNHFAVNHFLDGIEVRNLERPHRLDDRGEHVFRVARRAAASQPLARRSQRTQDLCTVESLPRTVITETHDGLTIVKDYHY